MKLGKYGNILDENEIFNLTYVIVLASTWLFNLVKLFFFAPAYIEFDICISA
jgi:hypothetical protein